MEVCNVDSPWAWVLVLAVYLSRLPGWRGSKELACQCRTHKRCGFDPWVGKIPWRRKCQLTAVFLPGKCHGCRSLVGCSPWGLKESDTTEHAHTLYFSGSKTSKGHFSLLGVQFPSMLVCVDF